MAAPAETLEIGSYFAKSDLPFAIGMVEVPYSPEANTGEGKFCISADMVPWLSATRDEVRDVSIRIIDARRDKLREGEFDDVPLDVDAIGTAAKVALVKEAFGVDSPEYADARAGLLMDCRRKAEEALFKNTYKYFSPTVQEYDPETDMMFANGFSVDEMLDGGLTPLGEAEEVDRRVNDSVIHGTLKHMIKSRQARGLGVLQASPCPDWAIQSLKDRPKSAHGGYAPEIKKVMLNFDWFDHEAGKAFHEQFGVSGKYITPEVLCKGYVAMGVLEEGQTLSKTEIHGTQGVVSAEHISTKRIPGVIGFLRVLDTIASEKSGLNIFRGEVVDADHPKNYEQIIEDSQQRQQEVENLANGLARYVEDLHEQGTDHALGTVLVEKFIQEKLLDITENNPGLAEIVFNKDTADKFREAIGQRALGNDRLAQQLIEDARINAPAASSCGAGSCGLENVKKGDLAEVKKLADYEEGDTLLADAVRPCPECRQMTIVYSVKSGGSSFTKLCTNKECGVKEVNGMRSQSKRPKITFFSKSQNRAMVLGGEAA